MGKKWVGFGGTRGGTQLKQGINERPVDKEVLRTAELGEAWENQSALEIVYATTVSDETSETTRETRVLQ